MDKNYTFEEKIELVKKAILKHVPAKYIYLFGSYAYGEPTEDSDIDIYTVIPDEVDFNTFIISFLSVISILTDLAYSTM